MHIQPKFAPLPPLPDINVHSYLFDKDLPEYTAQIDSVTGHRRTLRQFLDRARDGAAALSAPSAQGGAGLRAGDEMVGILSHNCLDYVALIHSLLVLTTPFALLSFYSTAYELTHALRLSKATCLFVAPDLVSLAQRCAKEVGLPQDKIYILEGHAKGKRSYHDLVVTARKRKIPRPSIRPAVKDTLAYLVFSSGTTGLPKAVMITHGNLVCALAQYQAVAEAVFAVYPPPTYATPEGIPVSLAFLPFYHTFGLHMFNFRCFLAPTTCVVVPKWNAEHVLRIIPKYKITFISLVPSVVQPFLDAQKRLKSDLSSLVSFGSGAAYLPPRLAEELARIGPNTTGVAEGYGMSETVRSSSVRPALPGGLFRPRVGSAGILLPGMEALVLRDDGTHAGVGEPGELLLKGENIVRGYWQNEKATREAFVEGGWMRTGDRFSVDQDGMFFFEDRAKDILKVSGMQVSPTEIESVLMAQPDKLIKDAAVAGVSGGRTSDEKVPRAWVVLSSAGRKRSKADVVRALDDWTKEHLSKYKWLRGGIQIVDAIPKSPTGKVLRRQLQDEYEKRAKAKAKL
ncbi:acetyl-CoA synthetase-like protein [Gloeophyllum trabeum ATCC 11539]|uniref:Acetyl-CoA synthetase-like protein n=1 Tax=Gloeophyllum trabeum (strain ATCC 11539 / FP-39264 / Madison 617) TaxID=670483 RepID=S7RJT5_GLOTA|nr:acetyl-CoA synthetase-like protein [Gloeophyllum trabeum ATCC 11539]EPQ54625.1 acetyl-CoA synthetase-like protein [Gloeophyllum trabeum ATCC 11539]